MRLLLDTAYDLFIDMDRSVIFVETDYYVWGKRGYAWDGQVFYKLSKVEKKRREAAQREL